MRVCVGGDGLDVLCVSGSFCPFFTLHLNESLFSVVNYFKTQRGAQRDPTRIHKLQPHALSLISIKLFLALHPVCVCVCVCVYA